MTRMVRGTTFISRTQNCLVTLALKHMHLQSNLPKYSCTKTTSQNPRIAFICKAMIEGEMNSPVLWGEMTRTVGRIYSSISHN